MLKAYFDWDPSKDLENQEKHGVSFNDAQYAFADPRRLIAEDLSHSGSEQRYYKQFQNPLALGRHRSFAYNTIVAHGDNGAK